jgi:hypothetical protein
MNTGEAISGVSPSGERKGKQQAVHNILMSTFPPAPSRPTAWRSCLADLVLDVAPQELSKVVQKCPNPRVGRPQSDTTSLEAVLSRPGVKQQV